MITNYNDITLNDLIYMNDFQYNKATYIAKIVSYLTNTKFVPVPHHPFGTDITLEQVTNYYLDYGRNFTFRICMTRKTNLCSLYIIYIGVSCDTIVSNVTLFDALNAYFNIMINELVK